MNVKHTLVSKRKIQQLIDNGIVRSVNKLTPPPPFSSTMYVVNFFFNLVTGMTLDFTL